MARVELQRKSGLSPAAFAAAHLDGIGLPVIVTDATDAWPARREWTFERFRERFASDFVSVARGLLGAHAKMTRFGAYLDYLDDPAAELPGFWTSTSDGKPLREAPAPVDAPFYLLDWNAFQRHPELRGEVSPAHYFVEDWLDGIGPALRELFEFTNSREYSSVYIGPAGTYSPLHQDFGHTFTCLAQVQGRKEVALVAPDEGESQANVQLLEADACAETGAVCVYRGSIGPGDMLFIPPNWWHALRATEKSITVSHNFFNAANADRHLSELLQRLPRMNEGLANSPELRQRLGISWTPELLRRGVP